MRCNVIQNIVIESLTSFCQESSRYAKPGASLKNIATNSGYLKVERTPTKIPKVQRVMSSAARRAAEAAENRMTASTLQRYDPLDCVHML